MSGAGREKKDNPRSNTVWHQEPMRNTKDALAGSLQQPQNSFINSVNGSFKHYVDINAFGQLPQQIV